MKAGKHSTSELFDSNGKRLPSLDYWVLPDKPMSKPKRHHVLRGGYQEWDRESTRKQTEQIRAYLKSACTGRWMEQSNRFYFELEEDWEMFKTMCLLGWQ